MFKKIIGAYLAAGLGVALADSSMHRYVQNTYDELEKKLRQCYDEIDEEAMRKTKRCIRWITTVVYGSVYAIAWPIRVKDIYMN